MPGGVFVHERISAAPPRPYECAAGCVAHYAIGTDLALAFVLLMPGNWLQRPTLLPALAFGIVTVAAPYLVMQPVLGLGIASSRAPHPNRARLKSLATHTMFGFGLCLWAVLLNAVVPRAAD